MHAAVAGVSQLVGEDGDRVCIVDTDATVEQFLRVATIRADAILVVVEPYFTSLETGLRMTKLGRKQGYERVALLANKVRNDEEAQTVHDFAAENGLEVAGLVPFDVRMPDAEWAQSAPLDFDPDAPSIAAIDELAGRLAEQYV
jgi:CO dehydrogenase maturation factor